MTFSLILLATIIDAIILAWLIMITYNVWRSVEKQGNGITKSLALLFASFGIVWIWSVVADIMGFFGPPDLMVIFMSRVFVLGILLGALINFQLR